VPFAKERVGIGFLFYLLFPIVLFVMEEELCVYKNLMRNARDAMEQDFILEVIFTAGLAMEKVLYLRNRINGWFNI